MIGRGLLVVSREYSDNMEPAVGGVQLSAVLFGLQINGRPGTPTVTISRAATETRRGGASVQSRDGTQLHDLNPMRDFHTVEGYSSETETEHGWFSYPRSCRILVFTFCSLLRRRKVSSYETNALCRHSMCRRQASKTTPCSSSASAL